eukprot:TRINITY_DN15459_c1_g1_i4.p1 TRINITY_DN15459_c1_g1~~TRINITY_DN15459_c1_g1_i4.p1  ORF type:complete len:598 (-),score=166.59 TRINITY_DN15459_c1_g1_i4:74-1867(-)
MLSRFLLFVATSLPVIQPLAPSPDPGSMSRVIFNEFTNLTDEQALIMAFNYTTTLFMADEPIPVSVPATFAFDPQSPLKHLLPSHVKINAGLDHYNLPTEYDFHLFPPDDVLAPLYKYELENEKPTKIILGKRLDPHLVDKEHLTLMLENALTLPRHSQRNATLADSIGQYIMRKFGKIGLLTGTQVFHPTQFHSMFWEEGEKIAEGSNIIGIYPGEKFGTHEDKIVLVGAHWDTTGFTDGYNDNGSGVAAMIEVARALAASGCELMYSVLFVAFDKEEVGSQGSHEFVRSYLVPEFFKGSEWPEFQGAFILDTIMNFNETVDSQSFPDSWREKIFGNAYEKVSEDGFRGNFISLVSREGPEKELADLIEKHWNKLSTDEDFITMVNSRPEKFKMRRYEIGLGATIPSTLELTDHIHFLRSDHARFWYSNETDYQLSLRGLLFTDTGPYRGAMKDCYHRECDSKRRNHKAEFASYDFLAQTVQTVIDSVSDLTQAQCKDSARQQRLERYSDKGSSDWTIESEEESVEEASVVHIETLEESGSDDDTNEVIHIGKDNEVYEVVEKYDTVDHVIPSSGPLLAPICAIYCLSYWVLAYMM